MSAFSYETQGTNTYLVYRVEGTDTIDSMSLGMLTNNSIPGMAPTVFTQMDADKYIKYNVSAKIPVSQFFSGVVNRKRLVGVFSGIVDAMLSAEDYMIDPSMISMDLDYIFADVSTCDTVLICVPVEAFGEAVNLGQFFKNILFSTQFDQTENCDYVAKLMNYLNSTPVLVLNDFKKILSELKNDTATVASQPVAKPQPAPAPAVAAQPVVTKSVVTPPAAPQRAAAQPQPVAIPSQPVKPQPAVTTPPQPTKPQAAPVPPAAPPKAEAPKGKKIGMFDLLMHYSKENAELYKAQKAEAKGGQPASAAPSKPSAPPTTFAVPGKPNVGFAIPGQPTPAPAPSTPVRPVAQPTAPAPAPAAQSVSQPAPIPPMPPAQPAMPQTKQTSFGETTVLGGNAIGETTVLNAAAPMQAASPNLIRSKNNEKIPLNKPVFRIGKERSYVDYFIGDNTAISRSHANFITRDGVYFVVDTNSTNHTYVNGTMIQSNSEVEIHDGDTIRLANEDFTFKLY